jgi:hypothetical protein
MLLREAGSVRLGTATYPPGGDHALEDLRPPWSRAPWLVAIGVALVVAAVAVVSGVRRTPEVSEPAESAPAPSVVAAPVAVRKVPMAPVPAAPAPVRPEAPVSRPITANVVDRPALRAPVIRRRKPRTSRDERALPADAIDPLPELRTNVPIPD